MSFEKGKFKFLDKEVMIKYTKCASDITKYLENTGGFGDPGYDVLLPYVVTSDEAAFKSFHVGFAKFQVHSEQQEDWFDPDEYIYELMEFMESEEDEEQYLEIFEESFITTVFDDGWPEEEYNHHLYRDSKQELFDDYWGVEEEFKEYIGSWQLKYSFTDALSGEDAESLFIFDCSECSYDFLEALGIIDSAVFYVVEDKLYAVLYTSW